MSNSVFFSFDETDRPMVRFIEEKAIDPFYNHLDFKVLELFKRTDITDLAQICQIIAPFIEASTRTIVFVGEHTHKSLWVAEEVRLSVQQKKPVYAMRLRDAYVTVPLSLVMNNIYIEPWSESKLQALGTK